ncbi:MAG: hypothetical protein ABIH79_02250 [archaeon]
MGKKLSIFKIALETTSGIIIIFTAAAAGAVIGSGRNMTLIEWFLAIIFVSVAIIIRKFSE